jgi:hypothetical protein
MKYVALASKNTSPLPGLLAEARSSPEIEKVLRIAADPENGDLARQLS